jgi:hypothetical protein
MKTPWEIPKGEKNINFFYILVWILTKHDMRMTNINFFFHQKHPHERKVAEIDKKGEDKNYFNNFSVDFY